MHNMFSRGKSRSTVQIDRYFDLQCIIHVLYIQRYFVCNLYVHVYTLTLFLRMGFTFFLAKECFWVDAIRFYNWFVFTLKDRLSTRNLPQSVYNIIVYNAIKSRGFDLSGVADYINLGYL